MHRVEQCRAAEDGILRVPAGSSALLWGCNTTANGWVNTKTSLERKFFTPMDVHCKFTLTALFPVKPLDYESKELVLIVQSVVILEIIVQNRTSAFRNNVRPSLIVAVV